jgi:hypothetical protein
MANLRAKVKQMNDEISQNGGEKVQRWLHYSYNGSNDDIHSIKLFKIVRASKTQRNNLWVLLKKLPEYLRLQWGQHMVQIRSNDVDIQLFVAWVNKQNDVISKVEIGNEAWPTKVKNG